MTEPADEVVWHDAECGAYDGDLSLGGASARSAERRCSSSAPGPAAWRFTWHGEGTRS